AIANGVPLFKEPRVTRAKRTEMLLGVILGVMLLGLAVLARRWHIGPRSGQTSLSQIMAYAVGRHWLYYIVSITITIVLALAANTSFGGLPVLASLLARDNYLPHLLALRDDRQVFRNGIWTLAVMSGLLLVVVRGNTLTLIPLFAIGVFTGFTLSQTGLVVHWRRTRPPRWQARAAVNGLGAVITAVATAVFLFTKFLEGAWVVVLAVPAFILLFVRIHAYYQRAAAALGLDTLPEIPAGKRTVVVVPVTAISRLTQHAIAEALSIGQEVVAVTVLLDDAGASEGDHAAAHRTELELRWEQWHPGVPLYVLHSEFASVVGPICRFIDDLRESHPDEQIVVLIPVVIPDRIRYRLLHNQVDVVLSNALRTRSDVIVARVTLPIDTTAHNRQVRPSAPAPPGR
ncbi:MAG TPA: amino acid permease, partial [Acidimicrobiales bacterium]|nr:amino acid permease [Acidimicrobiales bacterium]